MVEVRVRGFNIQVYDKQWEYHTSTAPIRMFRAGRAAGKSIAGGVDLILRALERPATYLAVAPTYRMVSDVMVPALKMAYPELVLHKSDMSIKVGDSTILVRSLDNPDKIRGLSVLGCWWDESAMARDQESLLILMGCLRYEGKAGWLGITSTPKPHQWLKKLNKDAFIVTASSRDNPFLSLDYVKQLEAMYPSEWRKQEIDGEFVDSITMFKREFFNPAIKHGTTIYRARGWDCSKSESKGDWSVGIRLGADSEGRITIDNIVREQKNATGVLDLIVECAKRDGKDVAVVVEEEGGSAGALFVEALNRILGPLGHKVLGGKVKGGKIARAIPFAANAEEYGITLNIPNSDRLINEFCEFDGSEGGLDDSVDAASHAFNFISGQRYEKAMTPKVFYSIN